MTTIQRGNDRIFYLSLVQLFKAVDGTEHPEPLDLRGVEAVSVEIIHDDCGATFTPPYQLTPDGLIRVELTKEAQEEHGAGAYLVKVNARIISDRHHDGYRHLSHSAQLCRVVELLAESDSASPEPATPLELVVLSALRGADGKDGKDGSIGRDGERGADGRNGLDGRDGRDGKDGAKGERGEPGAKGDQGERGERGEPGAKGEKGEKGDPGADGAPAPAPTFEFRHDPVSGHTYLFANGQEVLTHDGERVPIRKHVTDLITTTQELTAIDMRPALWQGRGAIVVRGYGHEQHPELRGIAVTDNTQYVSTIASYGATNVLGSGWQPDTKAGIHTCMAEFYFREMTGQPIYGLLVNRERKINLVVRFKLHGDGRASLTENKGDNASVECKAEEIYDLTLPMYVNTGVIAFKAACSTIDEPGRPMMTLLDYRFVEVTPTAPAIATA